MEALSLRGEGLRLFAKRRPDRTYRPAGSYLGGTLRRWNFSRGCLFLMAKGRLLQMTRPSLHLLKGIGYMVSTISVALLAIVSWESASKSPLLTACLLGGAATSIAGMFCRWLSYEIEKRQEERRNRKKPSLGSPASSVTPASTAGTPRPAP
ncbi:hypothetical protein [Mesorhizobium sp. WSM4884]|uniref:hypothetical protein n=1 Tax=Mesorhizobium sp. WSM4884 TaxID=3038542 RepID=UPI0024166BBA|nr:hypothetical protein [Mesorhizobium sp. WSM4884]MDG4882981.1 hypothetical protein [Mesorhizobium sp. WSM4884]